ncbi:hypothetical protein AAF712_016637, partial [Marasmius tenuissimus]
LLTPEALDATERALIFIPSMLTLEGLDNKDHIPVLKKSTPYLHPLFMQVWFKVLDTHHPSWGYWSVIVSDFAPNNLAQQMELAPMYKEGPYIGDEITGPVVARHLRALALKIDRIPLKELILVEEFVKFVPNVWKRSSADPFDSPITQRPMVHAFSFFIARLISRRTSLAEATVDSMECTYSYTIATLLASLLKSMIDEYPLAIEVIKSGLVRAIFRAYPCLYDLSHERSVSLEPRASLVHWLGGILDQISTFLIYFSVNRTFIRDKKRIAVRCEDHEEFLESRSRYLYDRWMMATEKAEGIRGLRQVLIDNQPSLMCGNANKSNAKDPFDIVVVLHARQRYIVHTSAKREIGKRRAPSSKRGTENVVETYNVIFRLAPQRSPATTLN